MVITNNKDSKKVLATIAYIVGEFMNFEKEAIIYATGSTVSRTRLYQIGISNILNQIQDSFTILGVINQKYEVFNSGKNYDSFVLLNKKTKFVK